MNIIIAFRKHFGLSQSNLAFILEISVSLLKMVETGERELPIAALSAFEKLQRFAINSNDEEVFCNFPDTEVGNMDKKVVQTQLNKLEDQRQRANSQLVELIQRRQRLANKTTLVAYLKETAQAADEESNIWLRVLEAEMAVENDRWNKADEHLLQWKIDGYNYIIEQGNKLLQKINNGTQPS